MNSSTKHWYNKLPLIGYQMKPYTKPDGVYLPNRGKGNFDAKIYSGRGIKFNGVDQSVDIQVAAGQVLYKYNVVTNTYIKEYITFTGTYSIGKVGGIGAYEAVTYNNVIVTNEEFTYTEAQYLHTNPERFLYREDGVLKSKILPQNKIDAIEFYAPMCETDSYIRDYSKYSEINVAGTVATGEGTGDEVSTLTKVSDTAFDLVITTAGTSTSSPYVENSFITSASSNYYKVSFNVTVNSGVCVLHSLYNGSSLVVNKTLENGHYEVVLNKGDDIYQYTTLYFDGSQLFDVSITDFDVEVLDGIYPIVNYTSDQNIFKLSTGLQTCFWERDILGVPNRLVEKGIIGDPLKNSASIPSYVLKFTEDFTIESIWYCPTTEHNYQIFGNSWSTGLLIGNHKNIGILYFRLFGVGYYPKGFSGKFIHAVITFSAATKTVTFYVNGVLGYSADSTITDAITSPIGLRNYGSSYSANNDLRLFNIYTKFQDPLELYNNAVRKGLLS